VCVCVCIDKRDGLADDLLYRSLMRMHRALLSIYRVLFKTRVGLFGGGVNKRAGRDDDRLYSFAAHLTRAYKYQRRRSIGVPVVYVSRHLWREYKGVPAIFE